MQIHANDANKKMDTILHKELSYKLNGLFFNIHNTLGRFCREKQYADALEKLLIQEHISYKREKELSSSTDALQQGNRADFIIDDSVIVDLKAKKFITKEDYYQMQRYLRAVHYKLGMIVNFRNTYLKPKRVINTDANLRIDTNDTNKSRFKNSQHSYVPQLRDSYHSHRYAGFGIVEIIIAMAIFVMMAATAGTVVVHTFSSGRLGNEESDAAFQAQEGIEAVRSIRNQGWCTPLLATDCSASCGISSASNVWAFAGSNNVNGKFTRAIKVELVNRDAGGTIVTSGGTSDPNTKKVTSTVTWDFNSARPENVTFTTYLTNFRKSIASSVHGGMLVYGNGGTGSDTMAYRKLNGTTGEWEDSTPMPDFDGDTIETRAVRAVRLDSSPTRNEKIVLVRRYSASNPVRREQSIWAYVWNGTSWMSTGSPFAVWTSNSNLDARNFDGAYLGDGRYIAVYSDNNNTPEMKIWDGCRWLDQPSLPDVGGVPLYIVTKTRPGTNEVMAVFFGTARDTNTMYYNNGVWTESLTEHSTTGPANKEMIDFVWSPNSSTKGALVYPDASSDRNITIKIWTADGSGSGSWSSAANASNQGTLGAMTIDGRFGGDEFLACSKDAANDIYCYRATFIPSWTPTSGNPLTINTQAGIQRSYDFAFESSTGTDGLAVYSVNSNTPKKRIYTPGPSPLFSTETDLLTIQLGGTLTTVRTRAFKDNDDIMILMGDSQNDLYTVVWNGSANAVYTTPSGKARTAQGTNGSATTDFWYDFAWDKF